MIAAGGYVGLVGGATHVTKDTDYEKTGGGVVFRNMDGTSNTFTSLNITSCRIFVIIP